MINRLLVGIFLCLGFCSLALTVDEESITIATLNIHKPETRPAADRLSRIAEIAVGVDLLAIQEVGEEGNEVEEIAKNMGGQYRWTVSETTLHERFGFIWRAPVEMTSPALLLTDLDLGRKPFMGRFKAGHFDFILLNVHLFWEGSKKTYPHTRSVELGLLNEWLMHRKDKELDLLLIGDFNEPNMYYGYNFAPPHSSHYAFYDFLGKHGLISISLEMKIPTSIMNQNIYDHIIFNPSVNFTSEYAGLAGGEVVKWEDQFDKNKNGFLEYAEYELAKNSMTDHRMVKAKFIITKLDDDESDVSAPEQLSSEE